MKRCLWLLATAWLTLAAANAAAGDYQQQLAFTNGNAAFAHGDYEGALEQYLLARRAGLKSPALTYNLGVTYYHLRRYADASDEFSALTRDKNSAAAAYYNLGLIDLQRDRHGSAREHFRQALANSPSDSLKGLIEAARQRLRPEKQSRGIALLAISGGYDDNVTFTSDADLVGVSDNQDTFADLLAGGRYLLAGDARNGLRLEGGAYLRQYADISRFNQQAARLGLARTWRTKRWKTALGGHGDLIYLDGERFETLGTATAQATRVFGDGSELWLRYRASRIDGGQGYEQLSGWRQRARAQLSFPWREKGRFKLGYEYEWNDRDDLQNGVEFSSLSPMRHALYAEAATSLAERWRLSLRGEYRHSRYADPNVRQNGATLQIQTRDEDRYGATVRASYKIRRNWEAFGQYSYTDNQSSFAEYDYTRNEAQLGVEVSF